MCVGSYSGDLHWLEQLDQVGEALDGWNSTGEGPTSMAKHMRDKQKVPDLIHNREVK